MCRAVLLMESAITGESRLWLANHALKYCQTNAEKIVGKGDYKSLLSVVKLYEEQRISGLLLMIWFACIVGCDYSTMRNVGPVKFCQHAAMMVSNLDSTLSNLIDALMKFTNLTGIDIKMCKDSILAAEQMFLNGPVYDQATETVVQRSRRAQFTTVANLSPRENKEAYEMRSRWNPAHPPFVPTVPPYENPCDLPHFLPLARNVSIIPHAVLPHPLEDCTKPQLEAFLSARNISGFSGLNKDDLISYVRIKLEFEDKKMYDPLQVAADVKGICADLHAFKTGHLHANDVPYFKIPRALPLDSWFLWPNPIHRVHMKKIAGFTSREVMCKWSDIALKSFEKDSGEVLHMKKQIDNEGPARAELRLVTSEAAATLSMSSRDHTTPGYLVQHFRMAIMPSMKNEYHLTSLCIIVKTTESGRNITICIVAGHCSCLSGIVGRCIHTFTLLNSINAIEKLSIPTDELACTSMPCQWIIPTKGPSADITVSVIAQPVLGKGTFNAETLDRKQSKRKTPGSHTAFSRGCIPGLEDLPWPAEEDQARLESYCKVYQKLLVNARLGPDKTLRTAAEVQWDHALKR